MARAAPAGERALFGAITDARSGHRSGDRSGRIRFVSAGRRGKFAAFVWKCLVD